MVILLSLHYVLSSTYQAVSGEILSELITNRKRRGRFP